MDTGDADPAPAAIATENVHGIKRHAHRRGRHLGRAADVAHSAIDQTATAYQAAQVTKDAQAGVPEAQQALANLQAMAGRGDPGAIKALQAMMAIAQSQPSPAPVTATAAGWYDIVGVVIGLAGVGACPSLGGW
jgi:dihydroxyacetone kinase